MNHNHHHQHYRHHLLHDHHHQQQQQQMPATVVNVECVTDLNGNELVRVHYGGQQRIAPAGVQVRDNGEPAAVRQVLVLPPLDRAREN